MNALSLFSLIPRYSAVLAIVFLGETLHLFHLCGFAFILVGVVLASRPSATSELSPVDIHRAIAN
jgi:drug/metabolite transporter (DMT)-like permease